MPFGAISEDDVRRYEDQGFILAKRFFERKEIQLLSRVAREDRELDQHSFARGDGEGGAVRLSLWNHPGDTVYGCLRAANRS